MSLLQVFLSHSFECFHICSVIETQNIQMCTWRILQNENFDLI